MLKYTVDYTTPHESIWLEWLGHLRGKPGVRMAELGCFEGRSSRWFIENILTHPSCTFRCIDTWVDVGSAGRCIRNTEGLDKIKMVHDDSRALHGFYNYFDAIYVDADHKPASVLIDACNAWQALKPGGILIFDDYRLNDPSRGVLPGPAIDAFCGIMGLTKHHSPWSAEDHHEHDWGQVMVRKSL